MSDEPREPPEPPERPEPIWRRYRRFLRTDIAADVDEELEFHLAMRSRDYEARGLARAAAERAARERFGDVSRVAGWLRRHDLQRQRARRTGEIMSSIGQNLRVGVRALVKQPTFTAAAVVTLALGIGATTAMFSVVYGVLLAPLPFAEPDRVLKLWTAWKPEMGRGAVSAANARDWRAQNHVLEQVALIKSSDFNLTAGGEAERLRGAQVWASFFPALRASPLLGRTLTDDDEVAGHENVAVLSHALWVRRFGAERSIIGRTVPLNGVPTTIVGVMTPELRYPAANTELWTPLTIPADEYLHRTWGSYSAIARLKPNVTLEQARADLHVVSTNLARQFPAENRTVEVGAALLLDDMVGASRRPLFVLLGAVAAMLLIGCANLTNLLLARSLARRRELAVRTALGASRGRLVEQSITEILPLLALGAGLGLLAATWLVHAVVPLLPADLPRVDGIAINLPVLGFATGVVILIALLVGIWPAVHAAKTGVNAAIGELSRGGTAAPGRAAVRDALVVGQIAATLLLLVGAMVLARSFLAIRQVNPGFSPEHVLSVHVALPRSKYPLDRDVIAFYARALERVSALPGVVAAGSVNRLPLGGGNQTGSIEIDGARSNARTPNLQTRTVSPDYFRALGIPIKQGRSFTPSDGADAARVAIIDEELARRYWPGTNPIGHRIRESNDDPWCTIVGVVGHIRHTGLADDDSDPQAYWNYTQRVQERVALVVKTRGEPAALTKSIARVIRDIDPEQAVYDALTLDAVIDQSLGQRRFQLLLLGAFAAIALLLASIGTYGVIAYSVGQRLREFGVRMALGARRRDVIAMVLRRGGVLFGLGAAAGVALAAATVRVLASLVYGVSPHDTLSFIVATTVLFVVTIAACYLPARRAARIDPSVALRSE